MELLSRAERVVAKQNGVRVSFDDYDQTVIKFGRNEDVDTAQETIWFTGGHETLPASDTINTVTSSSASDGATVTVTVIGHTLTGSVFSRASQTVALNGQTAVTLPTPMARVERMYVLGAVAAVGTIYAWDSGGGSTAGVPTVAAAIHGTVSPDAQQTEKCAFTVPGNEWLLIQHVAAGVLKSSTAAIDVVLQTKAIGGVWRDRFQFAAHGGSAETSVGFVVPFLVGPNTDVRLSATSTAVNQSVVGTIQGSFGLVI